jgi:hypothetical protein
MVGTKMKRLTMVAPLIMVATLTYGEQAVYIDQVAGDGLTLFISQSGGDNNSVGKPLDVSPYFIINGNDQNININQLGSTNSIFGSIYGNSFTLDLDQIGSANVVDLQIANANSSAYVISLTGSSNTFDVDAGLLSAANGTVSAIVLGSTNDFMFDINADGANIDLNLTGDSNTYSLTQSGYGSGLGGHSAKIVSLGSFNTVTIDQGATLIANTIDLDLSGSNQTITITQSD